MHPIKHLPAAVAAALLSLAAGAQADTVDLRDNPNSQPLVVTTSIYILGGAFNGRVDNVQIGRYLIDQQTPAASFGAYCVDPFQLSSSSYQLYSRSILAAANLPPVEAVRFAEVGRLFANAYGDSLSSATKSAGFQLALWEIWHDDKNLGSGNIISSGYTEANAVSAAQGLLNSLAGVSGSVVWSAVSTPSLTLYSSATYQDYVVPAPEEGVVSPAPEPGTYALLLVGLGMLAVARRQS